MISAVQVRSSHVANQNSMNTVSPPTVEVHTRPSNDECESIYRQLLERLGPDPCFYDPRWLHVVCEGLNHRPYLLVARQEGQPVGILPLAFVKSLLFGVSAADPLVLASVVIVTLAAAMAASYVPARKILKQTPGRTLRDV